MRRFVVALLAAGFACGIRASAATVTNAADDERTGWYSDQASLSAAFVAGPGFAQRFSTPIDGQVYAQPLVYKNNLIIVTETNQIYRMDPETGQIFWSRQVAIPWNPADIGCGDLTPWIGVTGTPVIDPATDTAYFFSKTYDAGTSGPAAWWAYAVDVYTGADRPGFPVKIQGTADNSPGVVFDPTDELQRPGLLLMNGVVYAGFGGHCDIPPWQGWIVGVSTSGVVTAMWTSRGTVGGNGAAVWQSGGGLVSDGAGRIIVTTGNGGAVARVLPGNTPPADLGESVVHLNVQGDGTLLPVDFFSPWNGGALDSVDLDLGSSAPTSLPSAYFGTASFPHLAVSSGKQGLVYLLNRDDLGGCREGAAGMDKVIQEIGNYGGVWSRFSAWPGDGGWLWVPTASNGNLLRVYKYAVDGTGKPFLTMTATSSGAFGFGTGSPVITSNQTVAGSALTWLVTMDDGSGANSQLRAYDAVPSGAAIVQRFATPVGTASKFAPPGVGFGRIYVGTRDGQVLMYGPTVMQLRVDKNTGAGSVHLDWSGGGNAPFTLLRAEDPNFTTGVTTLVDHGTATQFDDPVLGDPKTYYYEVR
ncbi:MAG TPA: hypothetical protein VMR65_01350 [Candidatus Sulfotelmatobacter sp.]|jgi:iron transport multicopper oxidase|nr:hypothetical protein [Candidatus Sulfotelmatobacter sp.]